jgi:hypothetical protein
MFLVQKIEGKGVHSFHPGCTQIAHEKGKGDSELIKKYIINLWKLVLLI